MALYNLADDVGEMQVLANSPGCIDPVAERSASGVATRAYALSRRPRDLNRATC